MRNEFEKLREKLHDSINKYGINSEKAKIIGKKFDKLVNLFYKNEKQYNEKNIIYQKYIESMEEIRKITKEFAKFPTIEEWNKYAKEKNLLCSESLKYISGANWHSLRNRIISEI